MQTNHACNVRHVRFAPCINIMEATELFWWWTTQLRCCCAGGLGLAALQLAAAVGAVRIGTAGSNAKRRHMRSLGVRATLSSRFTDFVEELAAADAQPQALLNSLTSPGDSLALAEALHPLVAGDWASAVEISEKELSS